MPVVHKPQYIWSTRVPKPWLHAWLLTMFSPEFRRLLAKIRSLMVYELACTRLLDTIQKTGSNLYQHPRFMNRPSICFFFFFPWWHYHPVQSMNIQSWLPILRSYINTFVRQDLMSEWILPYLRNDDGCDFESCPQKQSSEIIPPGIPWAKQLNCRHPVCPQYSGLLCVSLAFIINCWILLRQLPETLLSKLPSPRTIRADQMSVGSFGNLFYKQSSRILLPAINIQVAAGGMYMRHCSCNSRLSSYVRLIPSSMAMVAGNDTSKSLSEWAISVAAKTFMLNSCWARVCHFASLSSRRSCSGCNISIRIDMMGWTVGRRYLK